MSASETEHYSLTNLACPAILFLVYNRPDLTSRVFQTIRRAKPQRLYVACDGPHLYKAEDESRVNSVREISTAVDWSCELRTLFRSENLGCKRAVSEAISWFFDQESQGIILEDDCLPHEDFFPYCSSLLVRYADDSRVSAITGNNFQNGIKRGNASYYFSRYNHVWGWASWRRAWEVYDVNLSFWPSWKSSSRWKATIGDSVERRYWEKIFDQVCRGEIDTWDYQWLACIWFRGGLTATPNVNLVSNLGFGADSTHTKLVNSPLSKLETYPLEDIIHPPFIAREETADRYTFDSAFMGRLYRFPFSWIRLPGRLLRFLTRFIKITKRKH
jgi:hypothetical protein